MTVLAIALGVGGLAGAMLAWPHGNRALEPMSVPINAGGTSP